MTSMPDIELLHAWHDRRNAEAFKELTDRYSGLVYAAARRILGDNAEAEDVTQESLERLAMTTRPPKGPIAPWLHRVATNRALDRIRTERNRRKREQRYADERGSEVAAVVWDDVYAFVDEATNELPEKLRIPMVEHFFRNHSCAEIAADLGITRQAVSYRIRKGVENVRLNLRKRGISAASAGLTALMGANLAEAAALPASLRITLGKLAVAGVVGKNLSAVTAASTVLGGLLIMKKIAVLGAVIMVAIIGIWTALKFHVPKAEPAPPSYVPRSEAPQPKAGGVATETSADERGPSSVTEEDGPTTGDVTGRIYNVVTGEGIADTRPEVFAVESGKITAQVIKARGIDSDALGIYKLTGFKPGQYGVRMPKLDAYPQLRSDDSLFITVAADSAVCNVDFPMEPGASVSGIVLSVDGDPVEGADVIGSIRMANVEEMLFAGRTSSEKDGSFHLILPPRDGLLLLQAKGDGLYSPQAGPLRLLPEGIEGVELVLSESPNASVSGLVIDSLSRPVKGAIVSMVSSKIPIGGEKPYRSVESGSDGSFRIEGLLAANYGLYLASPGNIFQTLPDQMQMAVRLREGESLNGIRLFLGENLVISGRVIDSSGQGLEGVRVMAHGGSNQGRHMERSKASVSQADGRFQIGGLEAGEYRLEVTRKGQFIIQRVGWAEAGDDNVEIVLDNENQIEGRVIDAVTGNAITQFNIAFVSGGFSTFSESLFRGNENHVFHPDGYFIGKAPAGSVSIVVRARGFAPAHHNVELPKDRDLTDVEVRLEPSRRIEGRVIDGEGNAVAGATIFWGQVRLHGIGSRVLAHSDVNGLFLIDTLHAKEEIIMAVHPAYAAASARVSANVTLTLEKGGALEGYVLARGEPVVNATVSVKSPTLPGGGVAMFDYVTPASYTPDGSYKITSIPPGDITITVTIPRGPSVTRQSYIESGQTTAENFDVELGGSTVQGAIVNADTDPERVLLELIVSSPKGEQRYWGRGNEDGTYGIDGVTPGSALLTAKDYGHEGGRRSRTVEFETPEDGTVIQDIEFGSPCSVTGTLIGLAPGRTGTVVALEGSLDLSSLVTVDDIQAYLPEARAITVDQVECDAGGLFELQGLSTGTHTLVAVTVGAADEEDIAQWRWTSEIVSLQEDGETLSMDFDFP